MKTPSPQAAERCFRLKCLAKTGVRLDRSEQSFCEQMFRQFPEWYSSIEKQVFKATKPFGSDLHENLP